MGWGIHYDPKISAQANFDHQMEQLVLCYVSMNFKIIYAKMMIQPTGGWYPICVLHPYGVYDAYYIILMKYLLNIQFKMYNFVM